MNQDFRSSPPIVALDEELDKLFSKISDLADSTLWVTSRNSPVTFHKVALLTEEFIGFCCLIDGTPVQVPGEKEGTVAVEFADFYFTQDAVDLVVAEFLERRSVDALEMLGSWGEFVALGWIRSQFGIMATARNNRIQEEARERFIAKIVDVNENRGGPGPAEGPYLFRNQN